MGKEIERKFIVKNADWKHYGHNGGAKIKQGYLSKTPKHVVRIRTYDFGPEAQGIITVKGKRVGMSRDEYEFEIPFKDASALLKMCDGGIVEKVRYEIIDKNLVWEIDVFGGLNKGFTMAEVELKSEKQKVILPSFVGREVTYDNRYSNTYIAAHKVPKK